MGEKGGGEHRTVTRKRGIMTEEGEEESKARHRQGFLLSSLVQRRSSGDSQHHCRGVMDLGFQLSVSSLCPRVI